MRCLERARECACKMKEKSLESECCASIAQVRRRRRAAPDFPVVPVPVSVGLPLFSCCCCCLGLRLGVGVPALGQVDALRGAPRELPRAHCRQPAPS